MSLKNKTQELIDNLSNELASNDQISEIIDEYYELVALTENEAKVGASMQRLATLFSLENVPAGSLASTICGSLVEYGFSAKYISDEFIGFFEEMLDKAGRFLDEVHTALQKRPDEDEYDLLVELKEELALQMPEEIQAFLAIDQYFPCGVALFSSEPKEFEQAKSRLVNKVSTYAQFSSGLHWLSKLFEVMFDEPILVIDLNTRKGIVGKMSGVADNFQLQILLMGVPELNSEINVSNQDLDVVKGYGEQITENTVIGKWNMHNWKYVHQKETLDNNDSTNWIWGEGIPQDIDVYKIYRVILLDNPTYDRIIRVQRTFNNLSASILVEQELTESEVQVWLDELNNH